MDIGQILQLILAQQAPGGDPSTTMREPLPPVPPSPLQIPQVGPMPASAAQSTMDADLTLDPTAHGGGESPERRMFWNQKMQQLPLAMQLAMMRGAK